MKRIQPTTSFLVNPEPKGMELEVKHQGSIPNREIHQILPLCQQSDKPHLLLKTKDGNLYIHKLLEDKLQEVNTSSPPIKDVLRVINVIEEVDGRQVVILLQTPSGLDVYDFNSSNGAFTFVTRDTQFPAIGSNPMILAGKFATNPAYFGVITRMEASIGKMFLLKGNLAQDRPFKRFWGAPKELTNAEQIFISPSGYPNSKTEEFQPDWFSAKVGDSIHFFRFSNETEILKVSSLKLPNDLVNSVKDLQILNLQQQKQLVIFFKEDLNIIYTFDGPTGEFKVKNYFYGSNSSLSFSCNSNRTGGVFDVSDGPTIRNFKEDSTTLSDEPFKWSGELLKSPFVFNDKSNTVWVIGNSNEAKDKLQWYRTELKEVEESPYVKPNRTLGQGQQFSEVSMSTITRLKMNRPITLSILDDIPSQIFSRAVNAQTGGVSLQLPLIPEIGFGLQYTGASVGFDSGATLGEESGWTSPLTNYIVVDPISDTLDSEAKYFLIMDGSVLPLEYFVSKDATSEDEILQFKVVNSKMTEEEINSIKVVYFRKDPSDSLEEQTLVVISNCVARHLKYPSSSSVTVYCPDPLANPRWKISCIKNYPNMKEVQLTFAGNLVTLGLSLNLEILKWDLKESDFSSVFKLQIEPTRMEWFKATDTTVTWYDAENDRLYWIVKENEGWSRSPFSYQAKASKSDCGNLFKRLFDVGPKTEEFLATNFRELKFQGAGNDLGVMGCSAVHGKPSKTVIKIDIASLDRKGRLGSTKYFEQYVEVISDMKLSVTQNETVYNFRYVLEEGRYLIELSIPKDPDNTKKHTKDFREKQAEEDERLILFDPSKYGGFFVSKSSYGIGNSTMINHDGSRWNVNSKYNPNAANTIKLGKIFKLQKSGTDDPVKLYQGTNLIDTLATESGKVFPYYPGYVASVKANNTKVWVFNRDISGSEGTSVLSLTNQVIQPHLSSSLFLVTKRINDNTHHVRLIGWEGTKRIPVVSSVKINGNQLERVVAYEYQKPRLTSTRQFNFGETFMIKGGNKTEFGYISYSFDIGQKYPKAFDGTGAFLEDIIPDDDKKKNESDEPESQSKSIIYYKWRTLPITELSPFKREDCQVGYLGFEDYEETNFSANDCSNWKFDSSKVNRSGLPLTGRNYLELTNSQDVLSSSIPFVKDQSYSISAWARFKTTEWQTESTVLQARIASTGVLLNSKVVFSRGDWKYLQIKVNGSQTQVQPLSKAAEAPKIDVEIRGQKDNRVDIDHVIFAPTSWSSEVYIYDEKSRVVQNLMGNTGLIVAMVYDDFGTAVAKTNGLGQVSGIQFETLENAEGNLHSLVVLEALVETGWIQGFQNDPLVTFTPKHEGIKVYNNGFMYSDYSEETTFSINQLDTHPSYGMRFTYSFLESKGQESLIKIQIPGTELILKSDSTSSTISTPCGEFKLASTDSILLASFNRTRLFLWTSEGLICDIVTPDVNKADKPPLMVSIKGDLAIENLIVIPKPTLTVKYLNGQGEDVQVLRMVDNTSVRVVQFHNDELGRRQAQTKETLVTVKSTESLLKFRPDFATRFDIKNQILEGEASKLNPVDGGVPFTSVDYGNGPLEDEVAEGRPGPKYKISGPLSIKYSTKSPHIRLTRLFPPEEGYKYKAKSNREGYTETMVTNKDDKPVAQVAITPGYKNILATYDYDDKGRLVACLPPKYHETEGTLKKSGSWKEIGYSNEAPLGTFYKYDDQDRLIWKSDPDVGTYEYVFNNQTGHPVYALHKQSLSDKKYDSVFYFTYGGNGKLAEVGEVTDFKVTSGKDVLVIGARTPTKVIEHLEGRNAHISKTQRITTRNIGGAEVVQELEYQFPHGGLVSDTHILPPKKPEQPSTLISTKFILNAQGNRPLVLAYALDDLAIGYNFDNLGQIVGISLIQQGLAPVTIARYEYAPNGNVMKETLLDRNEKGRQGIMMAAVETLIEFNSPGFPIKYSNPYFTQEVNYDDNGYGDLSTGDPGYPSSTIFDNQWGHKILRLTPEDLVDTWFSADQYEICFQALQTLGYLKANGHILKLFRPEMDIENLPLICSGTTARKIMEVFSRLVMERSKFGYKFQYGNQRELIKTKFFDAVNEARGPCSTPLSKETLQISLGIDEDTAKKLWGQLTDKNFIFEDAEKGQSNVVQGKNNILIWSRSIVTDLQEYVRGLCATCDYVRYATALTYSLGIRVGKNFPFDQLQKLHSVWTKGMNDWAGLTPQGIFEYLESKGYVNGNVVKDKILKPHFSKILQDLSLDVGKVFSVLSSYFSCQIGKSPLDIELYELDFNGNPQLFYNGFKRLNVTYTENSNKIKSVETLFGESDGIQEYGHDSFGNLNSIKDQRGKPVLIIDYDKVSSRPLKMELQDGRKLLFRYDYKGERVSKEVYSPTGKLEREVKYLGRDGLGRVLIEQEMTYISESLPPRTKTTSFFYGPRGLFGFIRNGKYFNVLLDNIGSTRLVLRNGQVAASYTYLPYGGLVSKYIGPDPDADIRYRFTGQEFDDETGLYNFHFRIYDPVLGRFYQVDPEEVFYSPYKYVGNAPIIFVDPDGREPITILFIGLALFGAYLGASAAGGSWNPAKWDWKNWKGILIGAFFGALSGYFLIPGIVASFGVLAPVIGTFGAVSVIGGLGLGAAYYNTVTAMGSYNPVDWDWKSPALYSAAFDGFATGSGVVGGLKQIKESYKELTKGWRKVLVGSTLGISGAQISVGMLSANDWDFAFWTWDWANPSTHGHIFMGMFPTEGFSGRRVRQVRTAKNLLKSTLRKLNLASANSIYLEGEVLTT